MRWRDAYTFDMGTGNLTDDRIEMLLSGHRPDVDLPELEAFVGAIRTDTQPPRDVEHMATALAATARRSTRRSPRGVTRRLALLAIVGAMLMAMAGVAMAADGSAPGDLLYNLDRSLEDLGIGDGGMTERIEEFDQLMARGEDEEAFAMLNDAIDDSDDPVSAIAQHLLKEAPNTSNPNAEVAANRVAAKKQWIEDNRGNGSGADGSEFGQGVADIARPGDAPTSPPEHAGPKEEKEPGPPANAGPKNEKEPGPPANAGPKNEKEPGPPANAGPKNEKEPGPPANAGPKNDG